jgi:hypothetical protein
METTMRALKAAAAMVLAGAVCIPLLAPQAEARGGRNAALIGGAALGLLAGAALANTADADAPVYQWAHWNGYGYDEPPVYTYRRVYHPRTYVYVEPVPSYGYYRDYGDDWRWRRWRRWHDHSYFDQGRDD